MADRVFWVLDQKRTEGASLPPAAVTFLEAVDRWVAQVRADWKVMQDRHKSKGRPGQAQFTWDNRGSITSRWRELCDACLKLCKFWAKRKRLLATSLQDQWFNAMIDFCLSKTTFTDGAMTRNKLVTKTEDWEHGGAYWNVNDEARPLANDAKPQKRPKIDPLPDEPSPPPVVERDHLSHSWFTPFRVVVRMRLYDALLMKQVQSVPYCPREALSYVVHAAAGGQTGVFKAPSPSPPATSPSPPPQAEVPAITSTAFCAQKLEMLEDKVQPDDMKKTTEWISGDVSEEAVASAARTLASLSAKSSPSDWEKLGKVPDFSDGADDCSSVASSEPDPEWQWTSSDITPSHPLANVVGSTSAPTLTSVETDQAKRLGVTCDPPEWNAYLVATALEQHIFTNCDNSTKLYHTIVRRVRGVLLNPNTTLRKRVLHHAVPFNVFTSPDSDPSKFTKSAAVDVTSL